MIMAVDASDVDGFNPIGTFQGINGVAKTLDCAGVSNVKQYLHFFLLIVSILVLLIY